MKVSILLLAGLVGSSVLYAQSDSLTISPSSSGAGTFSVDVSISSPPGSEPAAVDWALTFPGSAVLTAAVVPGLSLTASGKSPSCTMNTGSYTCMASGLNSNIIANGTVATVTFTLAPGVSSLTVSLGGGDAVDTSGGLITITGTGSVSGGSPGTGGSGGGATGIPVSSLNCSPATLAPNATTTCTVSLSSAAPAGGNLVMVSGVGNDHLSHPSSITIAAGATTGTFIGIALNNGSGVTTITATSGGTSASTSVTVGSTAVVLSSVVCNPASVVGGSSSVCTLTLSGVAPSGGAVIALSSGNAVVKVPASATVNAGATSTTVTATSSSASTTQTISITGTYNGGSKSGSLTVLPPSTLSSITCSVPTVDRAQQMGSSSNATCAVSLTAVTMAAQTITLTSSSASLKVPASVIVLKGAKTASFSISTLTISSNSINVTITARTGGIARTVGFKIAVLISTIVCTPAAIAYPLSPYSNCIVTLTQNAPVATKIVTTDSSPKINTPGTMTIPIGKNSVAFNGALNGIVDYTVVAMTASLNGVSLSTNITIGLVPPSSVSCVPSVLQAGGSSTCRFSLMSAAPAGGQTLTVSSTSKALSVPAAVAVSAGATSGTFTATALTGYSGPIVVTITIPIGGASAMISSIAIKPKRGSGGPNSPVTSAPQALTCSPNAVQAGGSANCQLRLTAAADTSTEAVLSSTDAAVHIPQRLRSRPNQSVISFQVAVDPQATTKVVAIRAAAGDSAAEERLAIQALAGPMLSVPGKQFASFGERLSFSVSAVSEAGILSLATSELPRGAVFDSTRGEFSWIPDTSQSGLFTVGVSATDAAQRSADAKVVIQTGSGIPVVDSLENAATGSRDDVCSSGSLAVLRGGWLAPGSRVFIDGEAAEVISSAPTQVTFVCPQGAVGTSFSVMVENSVGQSAVKRIVLRESALGVLTVDGSTNGPAAAILENNQVAMPRNHRFASQPAQPGDVLRIPVTGLPANVDPSLVTVQVGDVALTAESLQQVPGQDGISVVSIRLPNATPFGDAVPIVIHYRLSSGTWTSSQKTSLSIEPIQQ